MMTIEWIKVWIESNPVTRKREREKWADGWESAVIVESGDVATKTNVNAELINYG